MSTTKVAKVVKRKPKGIAGTYRYPIWVYRVVVCEPHQRGHLNERGVSQIWESGPCTYQSDKPGTKDRDARDEAEKIAAHANRCLRLGFDLDTPEAILNDYCEQNGISQTD